MRERPFKQLRIAGKRHVVQWDQDIDGDCGLIEHKPLKISVGKGMAPDEEREALMHEVFHAVEWQQDLKVSEKVIRQLSVGVFEALRNNPKLVAYLFDEQEDDDAADA